tara:strand:- start:77 stop:244 length:168 start_codon:yes stop_codon:yes gene_type:complete
MSKTKTLEQQNLEKDLLVSGKYGSRKERNRKQYDRHKAETELQQELKDFFKHADV